MCTNNLQTEELRVIIFNQNTLIFKYNEKTDQPNLVYFFGKEKALLVDAGPSNRFSRLVLEYLKKNNYRRPDYIVITHYHWDHSFGAQAYNSCVIGSSYTSDKIKKFMKIDFSKDRYISDNLINEFSTEHIKLEYSKDNPILKDVDIKLDKNMNIDLGDVLVTIKPITSPHTKGSLVVYCNNVVAIGDASCGRIIKSDFVEDIPKLKDFIEEINKDIEYVIEGNSEVYKMDAFIDELYNIIKEQEKKSQILIENISNIHSTKLGLVRIKKNLNISDDPIEFCKKALLNPFANIYKLNKNWYVELDDYRITINSYSYTIITAHKMFKS